MRHHFWYILIHIAIGMIGYQYFTWSNIGGLYAAAVAAAVQAYAIWEMHKEARPRFEASLAKAASHLQREQMEQDYRKRLGKTWFTRTCMYALLTLISAMAMRGGAGGQV